MDATIRLRINPQAAVPQDGRVEWLDRHGPPPDSAEISVTASLREWHAAGACIEADAHVEAHRVVVEFDRGQADAAHYAPRLGVSPYASRVTVEEVLVEAVLRLIRETGQVPEALPAELVTERLATCAAVREEVRAAREARAAAAAAAREDEIVQLLAAHARGDRIVYRPWVAGNIDAEDLLNGVQVGRDARLHQLRDELREQRRAEQQAEEIKKLAAAKQTSAERDGWIRQHGSERLQAALEVGLAGAVAKSYEDERLTLERPGWVMEERRQQEEEIREPTEAALRALKDAREVSQSCVLVWLRTPYSDECANEHASGCRCGGHAYEAVVDDWRGWRIALRVECGRQQIDEE